MKTFLFLLFITVANIFGQTQNPYEFFPSSVGNVWEYYTNSGIVRYRIFSDSLLTDSSRYIFYAPNTAPIYKIDKNYNVYWMPTNAFMNWHYYKLDADSGEQWMVHPEGVFPQRKQALVKNKFNTYLFGIPTILMEITYYRLRPGDTLINQYAWPYSTETLAYGIGLIMEFDEEGLGPVKVLRGCIINGDTLGIVTKLKEDLFTINTYRLFQNYPNPFNSSTIIKYTINQNEKVKLKIYSPLGEEVKTLIDEPQSTGTYEVRFNADKLPSGIYIYRLTMGNQSLSKKMLLIK